MNKTDDIELDLTLFMDLINHSNDMIFILNMGSMQFEYINKTTCYKLGYTFDEMQALGVEGFRKSLPENSSFSEHIKELKQSNEGLTDHAILICKDGSEIYIEANVRIINRNNNDYNIVMVRDITERVEYIESIEKLKERLELALLGNNSGIWDWNLLDNSIYLSPQWKEMLGFSENELHNLLSTWKERVHPDDIQTVMSYINENFDDNVKYNEMVYRLRHKDDKWIWVLARAITQYDEHNKAIRRVGTHTDITKEKARQLKSAHQAQIIEQINDAVVSSDLDGNITSWNLGAQKLLDYSADEVIGKPVTLLHREEDIPTIEKNIAIIMQTGSHSEDMYFVKKSKELVCVSISFSLLKDENGVPVNIIAYGYDLTERKKAQDEIKHINENLQKEVSSQLDKLREKDNILMEQSKLAQMGDMLNMIAHQWRQPLNSMSASAIKLSLQNELDILNKDSVEETSRFIQEETQIMSKIINDFMNFNKPEKNDKFLLFESISQVFNIISPQLKNRNITLEVEVDREIKIFHNSKSIEHTLLNLIMNSRDAFEDSKIKNKRIKIFTTKDEDSISLHVEDNAGGIPANIIDKVFNPYFSTKEQGKGTGIGLYMSKQMIESIKGSIINVEVLNNHTLFTMKFENYFL